MSTSNAPLTENELNTIDARIPSGTYGTQVYDDMRRLIAEVRRLRRQGLREISALGQEIEACAEARRAALNEALGVVFYHCQPNNGALFSRIDDEIRALIDAPTTEGE